ncbi:MAG: hypothetical protein AAF985_22630, partial [Bacteroidota bacterium]
IQHPSKDVVLPPKSNDQLYVVTNGQLVVPQTLSNISSVSARSVEPIVVEPSPHPINYQTERRISATVLEEYFDVDELYSWKDHLFFRGGLKHSSQDGVIRFVANQAHSAQDALQHFRKLHEFESSYYEAVGLVQNLKIGHFYRRDFLEGEPLDRYIKNSGIYKKRKINQLNTNDLKLILQTWKAINGLNFACKNMQEGNILVQAKLKWNLSKSIDIRMVGFNTQFCTKAEMIEEIHQIFERQFGQELYSQIRSKFNI